MASYLDPTTTTSFEQPWADAMRRGFLESAFGMAKQPMPVPVQQVAGLDPMEMHARSLAGGLGGFTPYIQQGGQMMQEGLGVTRQGQGALAGAQGMYGQGANLAGQGAGLYGLGTQMTGQASNYFRPGAARAFYNPYEDDVVQQTMRDMQEANAQQSMANRDRAVSSGAFGGSRGRLMEQERERSFGRGMMEGIGGLRSRGFEGARGAAMTAGQGLGRLGGQLGQFGSGLGQLGGQYGQFGSGLTGVAGQYGNLGRGIGGLGQQFGQLGMTGQQGLMNQMNAFNQMGGIGRGIQDQMYGAQFDAASNMAQEPWKRMQGLQGMLGMLPQTRSQTTWNPIPNTFNYGKGIADLFGFNIPG